MFSRRHFMEGRGEVYVFVLGKKLMPTNSMFFIDPKRCFFEVFQHDQHGRCFNTYCVCLNQGMYPRSIPALESPCNRFTSPAITHP